MNRTGESRHSDLKALFDGSDDRAMLELIKDLVAMANAGGGQIEIGRTETLDLGIDDVALRDLDSSRVITSARRFTSPYSLDIGHTINTLENGARSLTLEVSPSPYPIAMAEDGNWKRKPNNEPALFRKGDVFTRHGTITERATSEDYRSWILEARQKEKETIYDRLAMVVNAPDGAQVRVEFPTAYGPIDNPQRMLDAASSRRQSSANHLLTADDLLHLFLSRAELEIGEKNWRILFASALRKNLTLYWWLALPIVEKKSLLVDELERCLEGNDRDKSDAARSVVDLICLYGDNTQAADLVGRLASSKYQHFKDVSKKWVSRQSTIDEFLRKAMMDAAQIEEGRTLAMLSKDELEAYATQLGAQLVDSPSKSISRRLKAVTRLIWTRSDPVYRDFRH